MIKTVTDRLADRVRPAYIGRHRRERPGITRLLRILEAQPQSGSGR